MKPHFGSALVLVFLVLSATAQLPPSLRITAEKELKSEKDVQQKGTVRSSGNLTRYTPEVAAVNTDVILNIKIQNMGATEATGLLVKYAIIGRDKQKRTLSVAGQGQQSVDIKARQIQTIKTEAARFESHELKYRGDFSGFNEKSGPKYYGIAVTVSSGGKRVGSFFDPPELSQEIIKLKTDL